MKKFLLASLLATTLVTAHAGVKKLTIHSRANCGNNESITWHLGHAYDLWTASNHIDARTGTTIHAVVANWEHTWRSAAVHWGEGTGDWAVWGHHWISNNKGQISKLGEEYVTDCSIYDGWWDH